MQLRDPAHLVSPRAIAYWTVRAVPLWILVLAGELIWWWGSRDHSGLRAALRRLASIALRRRMP